MTAGRGGDVPGAWRPPEPLPALLAGTGDAPARLVVISPHLDDAVLGCGDLLAASPGAVVVTAFAGRPAVYPDVTSWDARAGFGPGDDVVGERRREDAAALAVLGAVPRWLDFPDPQYGERPARAVLAAALATALAAIRPTVVAAPLGLFHDDHTLTADAALGLARRPAGGPWPAEWLVYADAIYRRVPGLLDERLRVLAGAACDLEPIAGRAGPATERKRRAVACYGSQVRALEASWEGGVSDAYAAEQYWLVRPRTAEATPGDPARGRGQHGDDG